MCTTVLQAIYIAGLKVSNVYFSYTVGEILEIALKQMTLPKSLQVNIAVVHFFPLLCPLFKESLLRLHDNCEVLIPCDDKQLRLTMKNVTSVR